MFFSNGQDPRTADLTPRDMSPLNPDMINLSGKISVDPKTITGSALNIVFLGQSTNMNSVVGDTFVPTNLNALFNVSIQHQGAVWLARNPLLAGDQLDGHHGLRLADKIVTNGLAEKVIITMASHGGSYAAHWAPNGGIVGGKNGAGFQPGVLSWRIGMAARCLAKSGLDHFPTIIDWQQGEWDSDTTCTTQENYEKALNEIISECRRVGLLKQNNLFFVHKCTRITAGSTNSERNIIRLAQANVCDGIQIIEGADIDSLGFSYRDSGNTHFTPMGANAQADLKLNKYEIYL